MINTVGYVGAAWVRPEFKTSVYARVGLEVIGVMIGGNG